MRIATIRRTMLAVVALVLTSVLVAAPSVAFAHGGGPVRAIWDDAQGFYMVVETNEDPAAGFLGGIVHVTMIPTATEDSNIRLRGMDIHVHAIGPGGKTTRTIRGKQQLNGPYEADLMVNKSGVWNIHIEVDHGGRVQTMQFPLEVMARSVVTDLALLGGMMMIPILGIVGMVRLRKARTEARRDRATPRVANEASVWT